MSIQESVSRIEYVGQLLERLQNLSSDMHACKCEVCSSMHTLQVSCINRALQEIAAVTAFLKEKDDQVQDNKDSCHPSEFQTPSEPSSRGRETRQHLLKLPENQSFVSHVSEQEQLVTDMVEGMSLSVLSSTMKDSGLQATGLNTDLSTSPIYDTNGPETSEAKQHSFGLKTSLKRDEMKFGNTEQLQSSPPPTSYGFSGSKAPRNVPVTPSSSQGSQSTASPFITSAAMHHMLPQLPFPDSPQSQHSAWPLFPASPYHLSAPSPPLWVPGYSLCWSPMALSGLQQNLSLSGQAPVDPKPNIRRYSEQLEVNADLHPREDRRNQSFSHPFGFIPAMIPHTWHESMTNNFSSNMRSPASTANYESHQQMTADMANSPSLENPLSFQGSTSDSVSLPPTLKKAVNHTLSDKGPISLIKANEFDAEKRRDGTISNLRTNQTTSIQTQITGMVDANNSLGPVKTFRAENVSPSSVGKILCNEDNGTSAKINEKHSGQSSSAEIPQLILPQHLQENPDVHEEATQKLVAVEDQLLKLSLSARCNDNTGDCDNLRVESQSVFSDEVSTTGLHTYNKLAQPNVQSTMQKSQFEYSEAAFSVKPSDKSADDVHCGIPTHTSSVTDTEDVSSRYLQSPTKTKENILGLLHHLHEENCGMEPLDSNHLLYECSGMTDVSLKDKIDYVETASNPIHDIVFDNELIDQMAKLTSEDDKEGHSGRVLSNISNKSCENRDVKEQETSSPTISSIKDKDQKSEAHETNKENKVILTCEKSRQKPSMGVRRSLELCRSNKNNNTNFIVNDISVLKESLTKDLKVEDIDKSKDDFDLIHQIENEDEHENILTQSVTSGKPVWGAPALGASHYLLAQSPCKAQTKHRRNNCSEANTSYNSEADIDVEGATKTVGILQTEDEHKHVLSSDNNSQTQSQIHPKHGKSSSQSKREFEGKQKDVPKEPETGNSNQREQNTSLPIACLRTEASIMQGNLNVMNASYEGNQSFPKATRSVQQSSKVPQPPATPGLPPLLGMALDRSPEKKTTILGFSRTPRNRRSIFGVSPPDQRQLQQCSPHQRSGMKEQSTLLSTSVGESSATSSTEPRQLISAGGSSLIHPKPGHLDSLWKILDVSVSMCSDGKFMPSFREVLFNTVSSSVCVVDIRRNGKIVAVNETFQLMIGLHERVVGQRLLRFIKFKDYLSETGSPLPQYFVRADGSVTTIQGVLATCTDARGYESPVSVWTSPIASQPGLVICIVGVLFTFTSELCMRRGGKVVYMNEQFEDEVLGITYKDREHDQEGCRFASVDVNQIGVEQLTTLETWQGLKLPVTLTVEGIDKEGVRGDVGLEDALYHGEVTVSGNMCGLMVLTPNGHLVSYDQDYFRMHLGYSDLTRKPTLSDLVSEVRQFGNSGDDTMTGGPELSSSHNSPNCSASSGLNLEHKDVTVLRACETEGADVEKSEIFLPLKCFAEHAFGPDLSFNKLDGKDHQLDTVDEGCRPKTPQDLHPNIFESMDDWLLKGEPCPNKDDHPLSEDTSHKTQYVTSTPCKDRMTSKLSSEVFPHVKSLESGIYSAMFTHMNGTKLGGSFKVGSVITQDSQCLFCIWVYLNPPAESEDGDSESSDAGSVYNIYGGGETEEGDSYDKMSLMYQKEEQVKSDDDEEGEEESDEEQQNDADKSHDKTVDPSLGQLIVDHAGFNQSHNAASGEDILDLEAAVAGNFSRKYFVREALGQGSFGFVRRALAINCKKTVVVKFIKKGSVFKDCWTVDVDTGRRIPLEVSILKDLDSDYIIKILDVCQNPGFVQMVMEDFSQIDLFDFIDQVCLDDPLACHLFRQVLWGVDYLHSSGIVHRDIKDENVVLNSSFQCKLIDFGSAVYMPPDDKLLTRFRGTMEYCSPEVFHGFKYRGPELDLWALGVTLYTMVYRVNPFNVDEMPDTFHHLELHGPEEGEAQEGSFNNPDLLELLSGLLQVNPKTRMTMSQALSCEWLRQIVDISQYDWDFLLGNAPPEVIDGEDEKDND